MQLGITTIPINTMKDILIDFLNNALIVLLVIGVVLFFLSFSNIEEEQPKRKQGNVQVPTLVEIYPENTEVDTDENTEVDTDTETVILSPQTSTR